jgi:hypothetical protein
MGSVDQQDFQRSRDVEIVAVCDVNQENAGARGKNKNQIVTAIGRELLGFIWAIAVETEKQQKLTNAA